jgi:hypothetical protein
MTTYTREDDYTLLATSNVPDGGKLCRYFNFAAGEITTVYHQKAEMKHSMGSNSHGYSNSTSVSVALTSQMSVRKFSELDSFNEITLMHKELVTRGGKPPALEDIINTAVATGKDMRIGRPLQLKTPD